MDTTLLSYLAQKGALVGEISLSTTVMAKDLPDSQQTLSRKLIQLEDNQLIERTASTRGINLHITKKGREVLKQEFLQLKNLFGEQITILEGELFSGLGEGKYYMAQPGYIKQFKEHFGFEPFAGTMNLRVDPGQAQQFILDKELIQIKGFQASNRSFGGLDAYKAKIGTVSAAMVIPHRTSHGKEVVELVAEHSLRKKLKLKDGDTVEVSP